MTSAFFIAADVSCIYTFHTIIALIAFPNTFIRLDSQVYNNSVSTFRVITRYIFPHEQGISCYTMQSLQPFGSIRSPSALQS